jgi:hypothetical protein
MMWRSVKGGVEYKIHLKEALNEPNSVRMINTFFKRNCFHTRPKSTFGINLGSNDDNGVSVVNSEWTLVTTKNHVVK